MFKKSSLNFQHCAVNQLPYCQKIEAGKVWRQNSTDWLKIDTFIWQCKNDGTKLTSSL